MFRSASPFEVVTRRSLLLGALGGAGVGVAAAVGKSVWKKKSVTAWLFPPTSLPPFDLPPVPELVDMVGRPVQGFSSAHLAGRRTVLNVWASWCPTCQEEHAQLLALAKRNLAPIYGVDVRDPPAQTARFLAAHGNPFTAVGRVESRNDLMRALGARTLPATFIVGPDLVVEWSYKWALTEEVIEREIAPRLAAGKVAATGA